MIKNVAGKIAVFAWDSGAGAPKTGDQNNITAQISLDGGASAATNDVNPDQLDATNHPGVYIFNLLQAETNADMVIITPKSTTSGVVFKPVVAHPTTLTPTKSGYLDAAVSTRAPEAAGNVAAIKTQTDKLAFSVTNQVDANVIDWKGAAAPAMTGDAYARIGVAGAGLTALGDTRIANLDATISSRSALTAQQVWEYGTRTLSSFGSLVADAAAAVWGSLTRSLTDKAGFTISGSKTKLDDLHDATQGATKAELDAAQAAIETALGEINVDLSPVLEAIAALENISVGDILSGNLADDQVFAAGTLADRLRKLFWLLCNKMEITDAAGAFTAYKDDGLTPAATGTIADDGTTTERSEPTWP